MTSIPKKCAWCGSENGHLPWCPALERCHYDDSEVRAVLDRLSRTIYGVRPVAGGAPRDDETLYESAAAAPWNRNQTEEAVQNWPERRHGRSPTCVACGEPFDYTLRQRRIYAIHGQEVDVCTDCEVRAVADLLSRIIRGQGS